MLHILLALSHGERHGCGIMKQVKADSLGEVTMGPGTLYGSIKRMLEAGLIRESAQRVDPELDDERRIYYEITRAGRTALAAGLVLGWATMVHMPETENPLNLVYFGVLAVGAIGAGLARLEARGMEAVFAGIRRRSACPPGGA